MSSVAHSIQKCVERLKSGDETLEPLYFYGTKIINLQIVQLIDTLICTPNRVHYVNLGHNRLTDATGIKLARYVATSSTLTWLDVSNNELGLQTYLALAVAFRFNTSLERLEIYGNAITREYIVDLAFTESLSLNTDRFRSSQWYLYAYGNDFPRLQTKAAQLGHPTLQKILSILLDSFSVYSTKV